MVVLGSEKCEGCGQCSCADPRDQLKLGPISGLRATFQKAGAKSPTGAATRDREEIQLLAKPGGPFLADLFAGLGEELVGIVGHLVTPDPGILDTRHRGRVANSGGRGLRFGTESTAGDHQCGQDRDKELIWSRASSSLRLLRILFRSADPLRFVRKFHYSSVRRQVASEVGQMIEAMEALFLRDLEGLQVLLVGNPSLDLGVATRLANDLGGR